ncbi:rab-GTPase-TBC domain-containing protein [Melanogaster broomeanus]|nr:rab-GTPase-TBC domain-containing protein [Melanogaster broomeanus]
MAAVKNIDQIDSMPIYFVRQRGSLAVPPDVLARPIDLVHAKSLLQNGRLVEAEALLNRAEYDLTHGSTVMVTRQTYYAIYTNVSHLRSCVRPDLERPQRTLGESSVQGDVADYIEVEVWDGVREYMPQETSVDDLKTESGTRTSPATIAMREGLMSEAGEMVKGILGAILESPEGRDGMSLSPRPPLRACARGRSPIGFIRSPTASHFFWVFFAFRIPVQFKTAFETYDSDVFERCISFPYTSNALVVIIITRTTRVPSLTINVNVNDSVDARNESTRVLAPVLAQFELWGALVEMWNVVGEVERVVEVLVGLVEGNHTDPSVVDPLGQLFGILAPTSSGPSGITIGASVNLTEQERRVLVRRWGAWLAGKDVERGLKLLTSIQPTRTRRPTGAVGRGKDKEREQETQKADELAILSELRHTNVLAAKRYLEWLVVGRGLGRGGKETKEETELMEELIWSCVEEVLQWAEDETVGRLWRAKATSYTSSPSTSTPTAISSSPPPPSKSPSPLSSTAPPRPPFLSYFASTTPDSPSKRARIKSLLVLQSLNEGKGIVKDINERIVNKGWEKVLGLEMAVLHSKVPSAYATLRSLHALRDTSTAESYASSGGVTGVISTKVGVGAAEGCGLVEWGGWFGRSGSGSVKGEGHGGTEGDLLRMLLEVYMEDGDTQQTAKLLSSQSGRLDVVDILPLVPPTWPLHTISTYLTRSLRRSQHISHEGQIVKAICAGQNLAVLESTFEVLRDGGAIVEEAVSDDEEGEEGRRGCWREEREMQGGALMRKLDYILVKRGSGQRWMCAEEEREYVRAYRCLPVSVLGYRTKCAPQEIKRSRPDFGAKYTRGAPTSASFPNRLWSCALRVNPLGAGRRPALLGVQPLSDPPPYSEVNSESVDQMTESIDDAYPEADPHADERQMKLDTDRSFVLYPVDSSVTSDRDALQTDLHGLLVSLFRKRRQLHYFQGFHDIITVIFLTLPRPLHLACAEKMALHRVRDAMGVGLEPILGLLRVLRNLMRLVDPEYAQLLESTSPLPYHALPHILTLFSHDVPTLPLIQHIWDFLLSREPIAVVWLVAALVLHRKPSVYLLAEQDEEGMIHSLLGRLPELVDAEPEFIGVEAVDDNTSARNGHCGVELYHTSEERSVAGSVNARSSLDCDAQTYPDMSMQQSPGDRVVAQAGELTPSDRMDVHVIPWKSRIKDIMTITEGGGENINPSVSRVVQHDHDHPSESSRSSSREATGDDSAGVPLQESSPLALDSQLLSPPRAGSHPLSVQWTSSLQEDTTIVNSSDPSVSKPHSLSSAPPSPSRTHSRSSSSHPTRPSSPEHPSVISNKPTTRSFHSPPPNSRLRSKPTPLSLPCLLRQADVLLAAYPPSHPSVRVNEITGPDSAMRTWHAPPISTISTKATDAAPDQAPYNETDDYFESLVNSSRIKKFRDQPRAAGKGLLNPRRIGLRLGALTPAERRLLLAGALLVVGAAIALKMPGSGSEGLKRLWNGKWSLISSAVAAWRRDLP